MKIHVLFLNLILPVESSEFLLTFEESKLLIPAENLF